MSLTFVSGWSPSPPDERDHQYTRSFIGAVGDSILGVELPRKVDLSVPAKGAPLDPPWNQGSIGSCGPHTSSGDLLYSVYRLKQVSPTVPMPSRLFTYWVTREIMGTVNRDSGVFNRALCQSYHKYGWCDETLWPYDISKYRVRPPQSCFEQAATRKISEYQAVPQDLTTMKTALANGDPIIFGFTVFSNIEQASRTGRIPMPGGRAVGGHDVLLVGYDDDAEEFKLRNSWGTWGNGGYGTIPYRYALDARYANDFWTLIGTGLPKPVDPVPPPNPPEPLPPPGKKGKLIVDLDLLTVTPIP